MKPLYMLLSLMLILALRRVQSPDLGSVRWALISFLAGEGFCAVNYIFFQEQSHFVEYLHCSGMVVCFGFAAYAFLEGIDLRIIRFSAENEKCAALSLCDGCIKYTDAPCGLKRLFMVLIPAMSVVSRVVTSR